METEYFSLGPSESNIAVKIIRILFGFLCIAIAVFWLIFNLRSLGSDHMLWITILFLSGFGMYQIWAGLGRAKRFIEISKEKIIIRKNSFLPERKLIPGEIKMIEIYPLSLIFYNQIGRKLILRFGTTYTDIIDPLKEAVEVFAGIHDIKVEIMREEI